MRNFILSITIGALATLSTTFSYAACDNSKLGLSRTIEIDTKGGGRYGTIQYKNTLNLKPNEVVLTFDDGPHPKNTPSILKTLADHCTKATFFAVGEMIRTYPGTLKKVADAGHTIAAHSHSHPNMTNLSLTKAKYEIERSFAEAILATGKPVAPFFRFPGLAHSKSINKYLGKRNIVTLSVDVISNDTVSPNTRSIVGNTMSVLAQKKRGIILLHDLKSATAKALPVLLRELKRKGYKVVHIVPKRKMKQAAYTATPYAKKKTRIARRTPSNTKRKTYRKNLHRVAYKRTAGPARTRKQKPGKRLKLCLFLLFGCVR